LLFNFESVFGAQQNGLGDGREDLASAADVS